jgi:hypothetical protein
MSDPQEVWNAETGQWEVHFPGLDPDRPGHVEPSPRHFANNPVKTGNPVEVLIEKPVSNRNGKPSDFPVKIENPVATENKNPVIFFVDRWLTHGIVAGLWLVLAMVVAIVIFLVILVGEFIGLNGGWLLVLGWAVWTTGSALGDLRNRDLGIDPSIKKETTDEAV